MEAIQYYRAMEAFCRQRAKMDGENDQFWLSEAEVLGKFATHAPRQKLGDASEDGKRKRAPKFGSLKIFLLYFRLTWVCSAPCARGWSSGRGQSFSSVPRQSSSNPIH
jgi:hypothetical protein